MARSAASPPDGDPFADALVDLILSSHRLHPEAIVETTAAVAGRLGARDLTVLLVDLAQRTLSPLRGAPPGPAVPVDGPGPGEAFRTTSVVTAPGGGGGEVRVWLPLLDSADRIGVLGVTLDRFDDRDRRRWQAVSSYLGELIVAKTPYGDAITLARRTAPATVAAELRWAMLPPLTFVSPSVTVAGLLEPAYEIAGDTFDYAVNGEVAHLAILDAMGHGLEASRMANLAVTAYRHRRRSAGSLADMVAAMDQVILEQFGPNKFVTGQLATLDTDTGRFGLLNLGHPLPLLLRGGRVAGPMVCKPGSPVGLGWAPATVVETQLEPGDLVLLHTDGITEARSPTGEEFGQARFEALVDRLLAQRTPAPELLRLVIHEVLDFQDHRPRDDATLLLAGWQVG